MAAMQAREAEKPKLEGRVEVDDAYLGGARSGGKRGRGAAGKTPFPSAAAAARSPRPSNCSATSETGTNPSQTPADCHG